MDSPAIAALSKLLSLFGLSFIAREAGDFLEDGYLSGQQVCHHDMLWRDVSLTLQFLHVIAESICRLSLGCVSFMEEGECADGEGCSCAFGHIVITHHP